MAKQRIPRLDAPKAGKKRGRKIVMLLLLFFMSVLTVLFFQSSLSKIGRIEIGGQHYTTVEQIGQALGVKVGDSFFGATEGTMEKRLAMLPYVRGATVEKRFPGSIAVAVDEYEEVAYSVGANGRIMALLANNSEVEPLPDEPSPPLPVLVAWEGHERLRADLCRQLADIAAHHLADISQINPDPSHSYPDRIRIFTRSQFEVTTTVSYLPDKIETMRSIIGNREPGFITLLEADTYRPYETADGGREGVDGESADGNNEP